MGTPNVCETQQPQPSTTQQALCTHELCPSPLDDLRFSLMHFQQNVNTNNLAAAPFVISPMSARKTGI